MKLLLDESVTWGLRRYLPGHEVRTTQYMGWDSKGNGELLTLARDEFDALITVDQRIPAEQHITNADVAVIVLHGRTNGINDLRALVPELLERLHSVCML